MRENFAVAMQHVFAHEGGYVDHPKDPGGATKYGITARTLGAWRGNPAGMVASAQEVEALTPDEATAIYRSQYADAIRFDDLPSGIDYAVLDFAINSGVRRATETLQRVLGVKVDGHLGVATVNAARSQDPQRVIYNLCADRLDFLQSLRNWKTFGKGWDRRVRDVQGNASDLAEQLEPMAPRPLMSAPPPAYAADDAPPPLSRSRSIWGSVTSLFSGGGVGYTFGEIMRNPHAVWLIGIIGAFVLIAGIALFIVFRQSIRQRIERWGSA